MFARRVGKSLITHVSLPRATRTRFSPALPARMWRASRVGRASTALAAVVLLGGAWHASAADPCRGFNTGLFVDQLLSAEPTADVAPRANYRIKLGLTLGNVGSDWLNLQGLRVPVAFSRRVTRGSGSWAKASPSDFIIDCWTMEKVHTAGCGETRAAGCI